MKAAGLVKGENAEMKVGTGLPCKLRCSFFCSGSALRVAAYFSKAADAFYKVAGDVGGAAGAFWA